MSTIQLAMPTPSARLERGAWLPGLLHRQAHVRPDAVAVVCGELQLTFRELDDASGRLGAYLRGAGVVADDCVGHGVAQLLLGRVGDRKFQVKAQLSDPGLRDPTY